MPFESLFTKVEGQGHRGQIKFKMVINSACPGHNWYICSLILK